MTPAHLDEDQIAELAMTTPVELATASARVREASAHADACAQCSEELASARRTLSVLDAPLPPRDSVELGLRAHARAVRDEQKNRRNAQIILLSSFVLIALLAAARLLGFEALLPSAGAHPIWRCAVTELAGGAALLGGLVYGARRRFVTVDAFQGAAAGSMGAALAGVWVQTRCPEHDLLHLGMAHVGIVILAALIGSALVPRATRTVR